VDVNSHTMLRTGDTVPSSSIRTWRPSNGHRSWHELVIGCYGDLMGVAVRCMIFEAGTLARDATSGFPGR
jgi:hypothetical protein